MSRRRTGSPGTSTTRRCRASTPAASATRSTTRCAASAAFACASAGDARTAINGELMRGFGLRFDGVDEFTTTKDVNLAGSRSSATALRADRELGALARHVQEHDRAAKVRAEIAFGGNGFGQKRREPGRGRRHLQRRHDHDSRRRLGRGRERTRPRRRRRARRRTARRRSCSAARRRYRRAHPHRELHAQPVGQRARVPRASSRTSRLPARTRSAPNETVSLVHFVVVGATRRDRRRGRPRRVADPAVRTAAAEPRRGAGPRRPERSARSARSSTGTSRRSTPPTARPRAPRGPHRSPSTTARRSARSRSRPRPTTSSARRSTQLQADMASGKTTSQEITRAYLDRINAYDTGQFGLHAFIKVADDAMAQATRPTDERARGRARATCSASRSR